VTEEVFFRNIIPKIDVNDREVILSRHKYVLIVHLSSIQVSLVQVSIHKFASRSSTNLVSVDVSLTATDNSNDA